MIKCMKFGCFDTWDQNRAELSLMSFEAKTQIRKLSKMQKEQRSSHAIINKRDASSSWRSLIS